MQWPRKLKESISRRRRNKKQYKAVLKQNDNELAKAKERFQRDLDQSKADHEEHLKRMECKINEVAAIHETQHQRSQRDVVRRAQELSAKNAVLEEELTLKQQSQEEKEIAFKRLPAPLTLMQTKMWSS